MVPLRDDAIGPAAAGAAPSPNGRIWSYPASSCLPGSLQGLGAAAVVSMASLRY